MIKVKKWAGRGTAATAVTAIGVLALSGIAVADTLQDSIEDGGASVSLVAGSGVSGSEQPPTPPQAVCGCRTHRA